MKNNKLNSRQKGNIAENKAKEYLLNNGFEIITSNYYTPYGEIDIIATKDDIYHFIEVKSGNSVLSEREKEIKNAVLKGRVRYVEYRVE